MSESAIGGNIFQDLESHNPAIADAFSTLRMQGEKHAGSRGIEPSLIGEFVTPAWKEPLHHPALDEWLPGIGLQDYSLLEEAPLRKAARSAGRWNVFALVLLLVGIGFGAAAVGPTVLHFLVGHWQAVLLPLGGICAGGGAALLVSSIGKSPLDSVMPPRTDTEDPLRELKDLSERTASRLRSAFRLQLWAVLAVGVLFIVLILWSVVMVSQNRILYASAFGSGSVAMLILTQWKWQPFDRINQARRQADNADTLATGLRLRMATISAIPDLTERSRAQWQAVEEYLKSS
ncbi:MAG: hypothetical protein ABR991_00440 [Terracidiphilus sp.]